MLTRVQLLQQLPDLGHIGLPLIVDGCDQTGVNVGKLLLQSGLVSVVFTLWCVGFKLLHVLDLSGPVAFVAYEHLVGVGPLYMLLLLVVLLGWGGPCGALYPP